MRLQRESDASDSRVAPLASNFLWPAQWNPVDFFRARSLITNIFLAWRVTVRRFSADLARACRPAFQPRAALRQQTGDNSRVCRQRIAAARRSSGRECIGVLSQTPAKPVVSKTFFSAFATPGLVVSEAVQRCSCLRLNAATRRFCGCVSKSAAADCGCTPAPRKLATALFFSRFEGACGGAAARKSFAQAVNEVSLMLLVAGAQNVFARQRQKYRGQKWQRQ